MRTYIPQPKMYVSKRMSLWVCILAFLFFACILTGCSNNKEDVKLASTRELKMYALVHYGKSKLVDEIVEELAHTCIFEDCQYGFSYKVKSYALPLDVDGSVFGYKEAKTSDFTHEYYGCIYQKAEEEFKHTYDISYGGSNTSNTFRCVLSNLTLENAETATTEIADYFDRLDTRNYFKDSVVEAYSGNEKGYLGAYHLDEKKYIYYADENIDQMKAYVNSDVNRPGREEKEIEYLYYKQMDISEVPGLGDYELFHHTMDDGTVVTLYYFDIDGNEYFYADIKVYKLGIQYDKYYTNYRDESNPDGIGFDGDVIVE